MLRRIALNDMSAVDPDRVDGRIARHCRICSGQAGADGEIIECL